ncbi:hypothetical protein K461DRAFT_295708 [Myriangium duriaei CBS 260.36]|uniref:Uncharacterized protein n=1 Tax=Myriangium duriaei CBS 260.36 TaxID=1168546 RepID=A0A9P4IXS8_9PEZI|nr:hypothetical protein K461DRAFT_295708 [Myriangium duriaei CBS 260.36]
MSSLSSSTTVATYNLIEFSNDNGPYLASIVSADPTATTLVLNPDTTCAPTACPTHHIIFPNITLTIGQWALIPPPVTTGAWDWVRTQTDGILPKGVTGTLTWSDHCDISGSVAVQCVTSINNNRTPVTETGTELQSAGLTLAEVEITVTAGAEKLAAITASDTATETETQSLSTALSGSAQSTAAAAAASSTTAAPASGTRGTSASRTSSSTAATMSQSDAAANRHCLSVAAIGLLGLLGSLLSM